MILKIKWFWLFALLMTGCYYDNSEELYGSATCTPNSAPSFSADVLPILNLRCNNCHSGSSPSAQIKLTTYENVIIYVNDGSLMGSVKHASGYSAMPKNSSKLSACQIQMIQTWIDTGKSNN